MRRPARTTPSPMAMSCRAADHGSAGSEPRQASAGELQPLQNAAAGKPTPEDEARFHQQMEHDNCAFRKVEILPNNIGYIKFDGFMDASFCGPTVTAAMGFVAHTDAIIFDLRQNGGGQPAMVTLIASYLFDEPTHLIDIYNRKEDSTTQNWTLSYLPGPRLTKQPVFVLTSERTFSGAEEFAFDLKNQKRATIVGETTGGGAHPVPRTRWPTTSRSACRLPSHSIRRPRRTGKEPVWSRM
jgi:hypothetical protein